MTTIFSAIIRPIPLPATVRAFTKQDADGIYNIYVNDILSDEARERALQHEYDHIARGDLDSYLPGRILK